MGNHDSMSIFGNFYCDNCSEIENVVNMTFSLQFFAFSPQKLIIGTQWITNNHLTFLVNVLFTLKHSFGLFLFQKFHNYSGSGVGCIPSQQQSVAALMSKRLTSILESLQIQIMVPSRFWPETSLEIPDISTLLCLLYCSDFDCCFSRFIILFWRFWFTFLIIINSLFNFLVAVMRRFTFSESLEI